MAKDARQSVGHIVSHTHWDREWRWPVWTTRLQLIEFFKQLLELMERREDFRYYTLDGQSVMVTDYLEMAPEDRTRIARLVTAGRLFIGPWFTLPDPWPIAGECMVRNLLVGRKVCRELGGALSVGYTTFGWG
nr:alpha-mannosidase [Candidatus Sumerlaeota bacterium]